MSIQSLPRQKSFYKSLPKIDLHRHLEGSFRVKTLSEIARKYGISTAGTSHLRPLVQVGDNEPYTFENFLSKFSTLRLFYRSPDVIGRITREAIEDAALDNIRYLELRFSPAALSNAEDFPLAEVMDWVIEGTHLAADEYGVMTRLIASINRHESVKLAEEIVDLAAARQDMGIVGVDLAGNEAEFSALPYKDLLREAKQSGLQLTIHAGEWGGAENIYEAVVKLGAQRIGHGARIFEDRAVLALVRSQKVPVEVCITSNYQSGVIETIDDHPFSHMISSGIEATINTDDPSISQITLSDEYQLICEDYQISLDGLYKCLISSVNAAFLEPEAKSSLMDTIDLEFKEKVGYSV